MRFARYVFLSAGVLGLLLAVWSVYTVVVYGQTTVPDVARTVGLSFCGSFFLYVCWQVLYVMLSRDPSRYRPTMIVAFLAELAAPVCPAWLYLYGIKLWIPIVVAHLALAALFLVAFWLTGRESRRGAA
jgi:hypothetical protein